METERLFLEPRRAYTKEEHDIFKGSINNSKPISVKVKRKTEIDDIELIADNYIETWSQLIRAVLSGLYHCILEINKTENTFEQIFNDEMEMFIEKNDIKYSDSFSPKLFTDDSFITNPRYLNNTNHKLLITIDPITRLSKYICAVYTTEVLWVLQVLLNTLNRYSTDVSPYYFYIDIRYILREKQLSKQDNIQLINQFTDNFALTERCSTDLHSVYRDLADIKLSLSTLLKYTTSDITEERIINIIHNLQICSEIISNELPQVDKIKEYCLIEFRNQTIRNINKGI